MSCIRTFPYVQHELLRQQWAPYLMYLMETVWVYEWVYDICHIIQYSDSLQPVGLGGRLDFRIPCTLTKIRRQIRWDENILRSNLRKREIRARYCLRLHSKIDILILGDHRIGHSLNPILWLVEILWGIYAVRNLWYWHLWDQKFCTCVVVAMVSC